MVQDLCSLYRPEEIQNISNITMECRFVSGAAAQLRFCPMTGIMIEDLTVNAGADTFFAHLPLLASLDIQSVELEDCIRRRAGSYQWKTDIH
jgi:hypothetical protein